MNIFDQIIEGYRIEDSEELLHILDTNSADTLYEGCHKVTRALCGDGFDTCSIINVKSGKCPEDCQWCAQSAHYDTGCDTYGILSPETCATHAKSNRDMGIKRFSLVASGRRPSRFDVQKYGEIYTHIGHKTDIHLCASLGLADEETLRELYTAGVTTYHCNLETAPSYFPKLCTTHTQDAKIETLKAARRVGMKACSGGILGMGESRDQRVEFALLLHSLGIESIPLNFLHPIPGTPLGEHPIMSDEEMLETVVLIRLSNPTSFLRFAGGRKNFSDRAIRDALYVGINAAITGDLLTTVASETEQDMIMFAECGYDTSAPTDWSK